MHTSRIAANLAGNPAVTDPIFFERRHAGYLSYCPLTGRWIFRPSPTAIAERLVNYAVVGPLARYADLECEDRDTLAAFLAAGGRLQGWHDVTVDREGGGAYLLLVRDDAAAGAS